MTDPYRDQQKKASTWRYPSGIISLSDVSAMWIFRTSPRENTIYIHLKSGVEISSPFKYETETWPKSLMDAFEEFHR